MSHRLLRPGTTLSDGPLGAGEHLACRSTLAAQHVDTHCDRLLIDPPAEGKDDRHRNRQGGKRKRSELKHRRCPPATHSALHGANVYIARLCFHHPPKLSVRETEQRATWCSA